MVLAAGLAAVPEPLLLWHDRPPVNAPEFNLSRCDLAEAACGLGFLDDLEVFAHPLAEGCRILQCLGLLSATGRPSHNIVVLAAKCGCELCDQIAGRKSANGLVNLDPKRAVFRFRQVDAKERQSSAVRVGIDTLCDES